MTGVTNMELAVAIQQVIARVDAREDELRRWQSGAFNGGPFGDGRYGITNLLGQVGFFKSPPRLEHEVGLLTAAGTGAVAAAQAAQGASESALASALAQATNASQSASVASTAASQAATFRNEAANSEANALVHRNAAQAAAASIDATAIDGKLDRAGGVMTGPIALPNNATGLIFGDDVMLGDFNAADTLFVTGILNPDRGYVNFGPGGNILGCIAGQPLTFRSQEVTLADHLHSALDAPFIRTTSSADQPLPSGQLTILDYDTTTTNNAPAVFSVSATGRITVAVAGVYTISTGVVVEAPAVDTLSSASLGLFVNGNLVAVDTNENTLGVSASRGQSISTQIALSAGDIVDARVTATSVGGVSNGLARRLGLLLGQNATQVNHLSIVKCTAVGPQIPS